VDSAITVQFPPGEFLDRYGRYYDCAARDPSTEEGE
jgi:hypothetical protein